MKDNKVVRIIASLSAKEQEELLLFLDSPFFNVNKDFVRYLEILLHYAPSFTSAELTDEDFFKRLYPDKAFNKKSLQNLNYRLMQLIEKYITQKEQPIYNTHQKLQMARFCRKHNLSRLWESAIEEAKELQAQQVYQDQDYFYHQYLLEWEISEWRTTTAAKAADPNLQAAADAIDAHYLYNKLQFLCFQKNRQRLTPQDYHFRGMDALLKLIENSPYIHVPAIAAWYAGLQLLLNPTDAYRFFSLKEKIALEKSYLTDQDARNLFAYLTNTARQVFESDRLVYREVMFELYSIEIERGWLYVNGYLHPTELRNVIIIATATQRLAWAKGFLLNNTTRVHPEWANKEDIIEFCTALIAFEERDFETVKEILNRIQLDFIYTKIHLRRLLLKVYFEEREDRMFSSLVNSFRRFLFERNEKGEMNTTHLQANLKFITFCNQLFTLWLNRVIKTREQYQKELTKIETEIRETYPIPEFEWLLGVVDELK